MIRWIVGIAIRRSSGKGLLVGDVVTGSFLSRIFPHHHYIGENDLVGHSYCVGTTGTGKSTLLQMLAIHVIKSGHGLFLLDPHGNLAKDVIRSILSDPELAAKAQEDVIYFAPRQLDYVFPMNVLKVDNKLNQFTAHDRSQLILEAFRRRWPRSLTGMSRWSDIAENLLCTLIENNLTLVQMKDLLRKEKWRKGLLQNVTNPEVLNWWQHDFVGFGRHTNEYTESTRSRASAFVTNPYLRLLLGQPTNKLTFRRYMDEGKIFIANLHGFKPKAQKLLGCLLTTFLEDAAMSRIGTPPDQLTKVVGIIDEFPTFSAGQTDDPGNTDNLEATLSQTRKGGLQMILAHQTLSQVTDKMLGAIGNASRKLIFGLTPQDAKKLSDELGVYEPESVKRDSQNTTQHPVYLSVQEQQRLLTDHIKFQPDRHLLLQTRDGTTTHLYTANRAPYSATVEDVEEFCQANLKQHCIPYAQAQRNLESTIEDNDPGPIPAYTITKL